MYVTPDAFDPARLGISVSNDALAKLRNSNGRPQLPRPAKGEAYLGGPIPMTWIEKAAPLPGRSWHLACALWFDALCRKGKMKPAIVSLTRKTLHRFGLTERRAIYRALDALEHAGLLRVEARGGRRPRVTILPAGSLGCCTRARGHDGCD
jgi:hypothetical protein